jgi:hypothetical protein
MEYELKDNIKSAETL